MPLSHVQRPLYEVKANLFKGLAHPYRIRILELLAGA
ncbi:MAG: transcriptional regulator, partial [Brevibacterium aurantiacum]